ncbi:MAG: radical SAM protein [Planctomycetota bacterium]|nr:radical SAM protein [Planctomycetota bacterium]
MASAPLSESSHPRTFRENTYVYPVLSRRSNGISVGINLNPDKACNFDCIYCQVDRTKTPQELFVGLAKLLDELQAVLTGLLPGGALWNEPEFAPLSAEKKRVNDIAFSGDGEPTTFRNFSQVVREAVRVKEALGFPATKIVIISNATGFDRPDVRDGLRFLDAHQGEIWAKLDAGTPDYFKLIDHTDFPYERVLANILACAKERPTVIQSCFMKVRGAGPAPDEIAAYTGRLKEIGAQGGTVKLVQVYTVARNPAYSIVSSLEDAEVDAIAAEVRRVTGLATASYYGHVAEGLGLMGAEPAKA